MGGGGVDRRVLRSGGAPARAAERGFTLIEIMAAMAISIVALLANIYLINTANRDLALARSLTDATNLATTRIADFRAMTIADINATATPDGGANPLNVRRGSDTQCPDCPDANCSHADCSPSATRFNRSWIVSAIDLEHATPPVADLVGDLVKIDVAVDWTLRNKPHHVALTSFTTGKAP
jgi:prepilin-type N-terminal cleavage/methylation domain-containing protein